MSDPTLLAHLARRFTVHPENLATEALAYILAAGPDIRRPLADKLASWGLSHSGDLRFEPQYSNEEGSRPDLIGKDLSGVTRVTIEAKFWAGLTDAQPCGYLRAIPDGSLLLFVTPVARIPTVWAELERRIEHSEFTLSQVTAHEDARQARVHSKSIAITSWRSVLTLLEGAAHDTAHTRVKSDIQQLQSLCDGMDTDAFLPLSSEELTSTIGKRIVDFGHMALEVEDQLVAVGQASIKGVRAVGGNGWYGRAFRLKGYGCFLRFSAGRWATWGDSPLWLDVRDADWKHSNAIKVALEAAGITFRESATDGCQVPLFVKANVERTAVMEELVKQAQLVAAALPVLSAARDDPAPPEVIVDSGEPG